MGAAVKALTLARAAPLTSCPISPLPACSIQFLAEPPQWSGRHRMGKDPLGGSARPRTGHGKDFSPGWVSRPRGVGGWKKIWRAENKGPGRNCPRRPGEGRMPLAAGNPHWRPEGGGPAGPFRAGTAMAPAAGIWHHGEGRWRTHHDPFLGGLPKQALRATLGDAGQICSQPEGVQWPRRVGPWGGGGGRGPETQISSPQGRSGRRGEKGRHTENPFAAGGRSRWLGKTRAIFGSCVGGPFGVHHED